MTTWVDSTVSPDGVRFPAAPWSMHGQGFMTLLRLKAGVDDLRPPGLYAAAFVSYEDPSPLTYSELLVARAVSRTEVSITDIWVDSPASVAGGRELWAIPKELCDFDLDAERRGPLSRTEWSARLERRPIAEARFTDVSRVVPRLPFTGGTVQPGIPDTGGEDRTARLAGKARALPCRGHWEFAADGPLAWLRAARPLVSFRMADFSMSFG